MTESMITINVRGTRFVENTLREVAPKHALGLTRATVGAVASEIMKDTKREMNFSSVFSTGKMKRNTKKKRRRVRGGIVQEDIVVGKRAFYWRFHEYGDGFMRPRRMFGKAVSKMSGNLAQRFEEFFMKKLLQRLARERKKGLSRL